MGSKDIFADIYLRKILPILLYALPVACPTDKQHWVSLEKVHRFAARLCSNNYAGSYEQILQKLHWKPVSRLCFERQALLFHKYVNGSRFLPENVIIPQNRGPRLRYSLRESVSHELQMQLNDGIFASGRGKLRNKNFPSTTPLQFGIICRWRWHSWTSPISRGTSGMSRALIFKRPNRLFSIRQILPCNNFTAPCDLISERLWIMHFCLSI